MIRIKENIYLILKGIYEGRIDPFTVDIEKLLNEISNLDEESMLEVLNFIHILNQIHDLKLSELSRMLFDISQRINIYLNVPFDLGEVSIDMVTLEKTFEQLKKKPKTRFETSLEFQVNEEEYSEEVDVDISNILGSEDLGLIEEEAKRLLEEISAGEKDIYSYLQGAKNPEELALKILTILELLSQGEVELDEYREKIKLAK